MNKYYCYNKQQSAFVIAKTRKTAKRIFARFAECRYQDARVNMFTPDIKVQDPQIIFPVRSDPQDEVRQSGLFAE